jgi:hypothetical protein
MTGLSESDCLLGVRYFILAAWRAPALPFHSGQPSRRAAATPSAPSCQALQTHDGFFNLFTFLAQFGENLANVHVTPGLKILHDASAVCSGNGTEVALHIICASVFLTHLR